MVTMSRPVPIYAQEAYALLRNRFADDFFSSDYLSWFISKSMTKKVLHTLEHSGWIRRIDKGKYICVNSDVIFGSMISFMVPDFLKKAGMEYSYTEASAVEIWTDYSYIQRSWEHSPYYVNVLRKELDKWVEYFRQLKIKVFVSEVMPALGEFVVLKPSDRLGLETHNDLPVDSLSVIVNYCEKHIESFEYPLAYLKAKFGISPKVKIDKRVLIEAARAVA